VSNTLDSNPPNSGKPSSSADPEPEPSAPRAELQIPITIDPGVHCPLSADRCRQAVVAAAAARGFSQGEIGIRITDDANIRVVNARHLGHDYETDVISFAYDCQAPLLIGELVVSAETAGRRAHELGWPGEHELLLYIVHGVLHITGMDDHAPADRARMRAAERQLMLRLGVDQISRFAADSEHQPDSTDAGSTGKGEAIS
jgi:probable rRNA maturation factor